MDKLVPIVVVIILVLIIAIIVVKTLHKNNKTPDKETFESLTGVEAKAEIVNLDNLLNDFKNPSKISEMVASSSLEKGIKSIQSSINTMNTEIENLKKKEQLPKGSIMLWFDEGTPNKNWVPCDGATYFVQYEDGTTDNGLQVPDFRGKFIKGMGGDASEFNSGGSDKITVDNLPVHSHIVEEKAGLRTHKDGGHEHSFHGSSDNIGYPAYSFITSKHIYNKNISGLSKGNLIKPYDEFNIGTSSHSHTIPNHKHIITPSVNNKTTAQHEQQKFEPLYQEAKFIYYLGNLSKEPVQTITPPASSINQLGVNYVQGTP